MSINEETFCEFYDSQKVSSLRLRWEFAFGANVVKFYSEQGAMREPSLS